MWPPACVLTCIRFLRDVERTGRVLVDDDDDLILREYAHALSRLPSGQPGVGRLFFAGSTSTSAIGDLRHGAHHSSCQWRDSFREFPDDNDLARFDTDDHKFVAVALASGDDPEVVDATDSDWWEHRDALRRHGVDIRFLCPELFDDGAGAGSSD